MDSLTQIAVGIATVEAIAGDKLKNKSFLIGAILGTLPDLDVWIGKLFPYEVELAMHRGFSHSIIGILLLSPLLGIILHKCIQQLSFTKATIIVAASLASHVAIDLFTSWGVQLLYPMPHRYSFKTIFVVDILYTLPWLVALIAVYRHKLSSARNRWLKRGFTYSSIYLLLTIIVKLYVLQVVNASLKKQAWDVEDYIVKPTFSNIILWNINVKSGNVYHIGDYSLFDTKPIQYTTIQCDTAISRQWEQYVGVQQLKAVSENWYTITAIDTGHAAFNDLRFGWLEMPNGAQQYVFSYELIQEDSDVTIAPMPKTLKDGRGALKKIWNRITNVE